MLTKITSSAISLGLLATVLVSCGNDSLTDETSDITSVDTTTVDTDRLDSLGEKDFDGAVFTILDSNEHPDMYINIPDEERSGEIINDALFERDIAISERYNLQIEYVQRTNASSGLSVMKAAVMAGDNDCDLIISSILGGALQTIATEGILYNLNELPYLRLGEAWWSRLMYENLQLDDHMYFTTGDLAPSMYQIPACSYINRDMLSEYQLDVDVYELVKQGEWTFDTVMTLTRDIAVDVDGNGSMSVDNDIFGVIHQNGDIQLNAILCGAGLSAVRLDNGKLELSILDEHNIDIVEKLKQFCVKAQYVEQNDIINRAFEENRALVAFHFLESATVHLRDMEGDYSILPMPKYDESQDGYRSLCNAWTGAYISVPTNCDPEFSGFVTEALGIYSYEHIRPLNYDLVYKQKGARDEQSAEMLDIIFDCLYLGFNVIYNFGSLYTDLRTIVMDGAPFASTVESHLDAAQQAIDDFSELWG